MGNTSSLPSYTKLREIILVKLLALQNNEILIREQLEAEFASITSDSSGCVTASQFVQVIRRLNIHDVDIAKVTQLINLFDFKRDGNFDYKSFISFLRPSIDISFIIGKLIDQNEIVKVYQGTRVSDSSTVTLKQISYMDKDIDLILQVRKEIEILKLINHPNILRYIGTSLENSILTIVQEKIVASSVKSTYEAFGSISEVVIRRYLRQLLHGLVYLHNAGILHRNLNSSTVLIEPHSQIKLADFGLGIHFGLSSIFHESDSRAYEAPEVNLKKIYGRKADIWGIGLIVIEMILGESISSKITNTSKLSIDLPNTVSPELRSFINCCLERNPSHRSTCESLLQHPFLLAEGIMQESNASFNPLGDSLDMTMKKIRDTIPSSSVQSTHGYKQSIDI